MSNLAGPWAGKIYGTNTGNIFIEFIQTDSELSGKIRISDDRFGITIFAFTGTENGEIVLNCTPENVREREEIGPATVRGQLQPNGTISGRWETTIGSAGTFQLWPHNADGSQHKETGVEQLYTRSVGIGAVRIFRDDIEGIFRDVRKDFTQGKLIVTHHQHGTQITKFADSFLEHIDQIQELKSIKLFIQEPEVAGINRTVNIDLPESGKSTIQVSGVNESWVVGKTESLRKSLAKYESKVVTSYQKYGLNLNSVIFLLMIVFASEVPTWPKRLIFVAVITILLMVFYLVHSKLIPNTFILLDPRPSGFWAKTWPSILSWVLMFSSALAAAWVLHLLTK